VRGRAGGFALDIPLDEAERKEPGEPCKPHPVLRHGQVSPYRPPYQTRRKVS
jgi:hypothetical protein